MTIVRHWDNPLTRGNLRLFSSLYNQSSRVISTHLGFKSGQPPWEIPCHSLVCKSQQRMLLGQALRKFQAQNGTIEREVAYIGWEAIDGQGSVIYYFGILNVLYKAHILN